MKKQKTTERKHRHGLDEMLIWLIHVCSIRIWTYHTSHSLALIFPIEYLSVSATAFFFYHFHNMYVIFKWAASREEHVKFHIKNDAETGRACDVFYTFNKTWFDCSSGFFIKKYSISCSLYAKKKFSKLLHYYQKCCSIVEA